MNLLSANLTPSALTSLLQPHPPLAVLPPAASDRWSQALALPLLAPLRKDIIQRTLADLATPLPLLDHALYADHAATGNRLRFEFPYFERRRRLTRLAFTLLPLGDQAPPALLPSFIAHFEAILDEPSWALPAHVKDPSGRDPQLIDLFVAQTADLLAEILGVFKNQLPAPFHPRLLARLRRDTFPSFLNQDYFWRTTTNNWNAVCHQGVLGAALALETDASLLAALLDRARTGLPHFLSGFGPDGACSEGPAYWDFGFGAFARLNQQLETRTRGSLSLFADAPALRAIAGYGPALCLFTGRVINFSDCCSDTLLLPSTLRYLGQTLNLPACLQQANVNYTRLLAEGFNFDDQRTDLLAVLRLFLFAPDTLTPPSPHTPLAPDSAFPSMGLWTTRSRDASGRVWELAAKAGHNDEHHNHNDVGSFLLALDGIPLISEIGRPEYTRDYFFGPRYQNLAARTLGHSLPLLNGHEQPTGLTFAGSLLLAEVNTPVTTFEADLTHAYPADAHCQRFIRRLSLDKTAGLVTWTDLIEFTSPGTFESAVITDAEDVTLPAPDLAVIRKLNLTLHLRIAPPFTWSRLESHSYQNHNGHPASCRRLVLACPEPLLHASLQLTLSAP